MYVAGLKPGTGDTSFSMCDERLPDHSGSFQSGSILGILQAHRINGLTRIPSSFLLLAAESVCEQPVFGSIHLNFKWNSQFHGIFHLVFNDCLYFVEFSFKHIKV